MSNELKYEFCGTAWLDEALAILSDLVAEAGAEMKGVRFTVCELFTDTPCHLCGDELGRFAWCFSVAEGQAKVWLADQHNVDYRSENAYAKALKGARLPHPPSMLTAPAPPGFPAVLRLIFFNLHNRLAAVTA